MTRPRHHKDLKRNATSRKKGECPLQGKYLEKNVVYQATILTGLPTNFKERFRNDKASFEHTNKKNETELSKNVWTLKETNKPFNIKFKMLKKCRPYYKFKKRNLCLFEKFIVICKKHLGSLTHAPTETDMS